MEMFLLVFTGCGFFVIVLAPAFKLFKKAGVNQWRAFVPVLNIRTFVNLGRRNNAFFIWGLFSCLALPAYIVIYVGLILHGGEAADVGTPLVISAFIAFLIGVYFFPFPLISTLMAFTAAALPSFFNVPLAGLLLAVTIAFVILAALQAVCDFLCWKPILMRLRRPLRQAAFLFLPSAAALFLAAARLCAGTLGVEVIAGVFFPALLAGFVYYYYLGYSLKVRYRPE